MTFSFPISSVDLLARGGSHVQIGSGPCISFCANEAVSLRAFSLMTPMAAWFVSRFLTFSLSCPSLRCRISMNVWTKVEIGSSRISTGVLWALGRVAEDSPVHHHHDWTHSVAVTFALCFLASFLPNGSRLIPCKLFMNSTNIWKNLNNMWTSLIHCSLDEINVRRFRNTLHEHFFMAYDV